MAEQGQANRATKITIAISVAVLLAIAGNYAWNHLYLLPKARKVVADTMRDPGSVQFRNEALLSEPQGACGELNAKNGLGAYTGFTRYISTTDGNYAVEGDPVIGWRGYGETDRVVAMLDAQITHIEDAKAKREAIGHIESMSVTDRQRMQEGIKSEITVDAAYQVADLKKFKEIWNSLCQPY